MRFKVYFFLLALLFGEAHGSQLDLLIQKVIQEIDPHAHIGIEVQTWDGRTIFSLNRQHPYLSASTQKILPAALALAVSKDASLLQGFNASFAERPFTTELYYDPQENVSYLVFGGDPLLTTEGLSDFLLQGSQKGFLGSILYVVTHHSPYGLLLPAHSPGMPFEGTDFCYGGVLSSAIINQNQIRFRLKGNKNGKSAELLWSEAHPFEIQNQSYIRKQCFLNKEVGQWEQVSRGALQFDGKNLHIHGCVPEEYEATMCLPIKSEDLELYLRTMLQHMLSQHHLSIPMLFQKTFTPNPRLQKISFSSKDLKTLLTLALKDSDNLVADALFARLTYRETWPRNWFFAGKALKEDLERVFNVKFHESDIIESGSGFSLYNYLTPQTLVRLLRAVYHQFGEEFVFLLPQGGVDGTLKARFCDLPYGKVYAKTGSHRNISALAGYAYGKEKKPYIFSIFVMGGEVKKKEHRRLIDTIVSLVIQNMP